MVRDLGATEALRRLGEFRDRRISHSRRSEIWRGSLVSDDLEVDEAEFRTVEPIPTMFEASGKSLARTFWVSPPYRIEAAGLDWCATHAFPRPRDLSGGHDDQQVAEAVAIAGLHAAGSGRPRAVVLAVGDKEFREKSLQKIREIQAAAGTVVMVTHNLNEIRETCSRAVWLDQGVLQADGPVEEVLDGYESR